VCAHVERAAIDRDIVAGRSLTEIATVYHGFSDEAARRHKAGHLPVTLVKAQEAAEVLRADALIGHAQTMLTDARRMMEAAEAEGEYRAALTGVQVGLRAVELLAKLAGVLNDRPLVTINNHPQFVQVQAVIVAALEPFPDAAEAVASALDRLEGAA
jgi:hypothetical protein